MNLSNQERRVIRHLKDYPQHGLSGAEAMSEYGIQHVASRISDLKLKGFVFRKKWMKHTNRYGEKVHYVRYFLD